jgi:hypothetical protein
VIKVSNKTPIKRRVQINNGLLLKKRVKATTKKKQDGCTRLPKSKLPMIMEKYRILYRKNFSIDSQQAIT